MRHEAIQQGHDADSRDVAAVWPSTTQVAPLPLSELEPARAAVDYPGAAPDVPAVAGIFLVAVYATLLAVLAIGTTGSGKTLMSIVVAAFFLFMFVAVPAVFFGVADEDAERPSLARFLEQGMQTMTGHSSGSEALVQMLAVPVCLIFGMLLTAVLGFFLI
jgi:hypothetical protein